MRCEICGRSTRGHWCSACGFDSVTRNATQTIELARLQALGARRWLLAGLAALPVAVVVIILGGLLGGASADGVAAVVLATVLLGTPPTILTATILLSRAKRRMRAAEAARLPGARVVR
jgi:hypothetical protein